MTLYITKKQKIIQLQEYKNKFAVLKDKVKNMLIELTNELAEINLQNPDIPKVSRGPGRPRKVLPSLILPDLVLVLSDY